jgi:hypothetical protein
MQSLSPRFEEKTLRIAEPDANSLVEFSCQTQKVRRPRVLEGDDSRQVFPQTQGDILIVAGAVPVT